MLILIWNIVKIWKNSFNMYANQECADHEVRNVSFSGNFVYMLNEWSLCAIWNLVPSIYCIDLNEICPIRQRVKNSLWLYVKCKTLCNNIWVKRWLRPFMHNVEKRPNILQKSCGVNTARFLKLSLTIFELYARKG